MSQLLPADHRQTLRLVQAAALPAEAAFVGWLAWRAGRASRAAGAPGTADPVARLRAGARAVVPAVAADVLVAELAVLYYAVGAWRARPHVPPGAHAFTTHRRSGHGGLVFGLLVVTAVEGVVAHLLVAGRSPAAAWALTALGVYGALWLVADYRAAVLRPVLWDGAALWVRAGLRWQARVAGGQVARVSRTPPAAGARSLAFLTAPNLWVECSAPVVLAGPYGLRREARRVGLFVDEPERLAAALAVPGAA